MTKTILLVEDDINLAEALVDTLELANMDCVWVDCAEAAIAKLKAQPFALIISDVQMSGIGGFGLLDYVASHFNHIPILLMTAFSQVEHAVKAIKLGAKDYLAKPFTPQVLLAQVERYMMSQPSQQAIVADPQSQQLYSLAAKVAKSDATVLINGPSGAGKEVLAQYLHNHSARADGPFVAINCAAIPESMLESTLFGYEKGAFTGAHQACPGKFEQAQQGTLLLDEITEMALELQAKLLRVLQEKEVERLGSKKTITLDVRIIATSNRDLLKAVKAGEFREDLYYRLNVFPLQALALCQRPKDIVPLAESFIQKYSTSGAALNLTDAAKDKLEGYCWPGNVRELENVIQRALILASDNISEDDILLEAIDLNNKVLEPQAPDLKSEVVAQEHQIILQRLEQFRGNRAQVAQELGISPRTLRYKLAKMRDLGIEV
ncbi:sigma-54 dependent transcriptional regulator [Paraferrimonas sp. SM1919]|uniref:sigma-54-dependent transcriptional regulator n=1 Tax=Paraferrimonas sp. SM1919 TaxID=2662263 RepID=UPI0013D76D59|nr:sigma-54 dependent transcriptional regulator [Paraferrimonas sp. SM1919]